MIPMVPNSSIEDDRPSGLKFTRNNYFPFSKKDVDTPFKTPTSDPLPPMMGLKKSMNSTQDYRGSGSSFSSASTTPGSSPVIPTRSPHRIRDSQMSAKSGDSNYMSGRPTSSRANSLKMNQKPNNNKSKPYSDEPYTKSTTNSSISSCSSSSIVTVEDELTQELENIWKLKSVDTSQLKQNPDMDSDTMLLQLLVSHAMIEAKEYKILSFEEYETLKQHHTRLKSKIASAKTKLEIDKKIQDTSHSLAPLLDKSRESTLQILDQTQATDQKVKILTQRLLELETEEVETHHSILKHTAAVLARGLERLEATPQTPPNPIKTQLDDLLTHHGLVPGPTLTASLERLEAHLASDQVLRKTVLDCQHQSEQLRLQVEACQAREAALTVQVETYRDQVLKLRVEKERLERQAADRIVGDDDDQIEARYQQQLEAQEQEFKAQLKEQSAYLDKTSAEYDRLRIEHQTLTETCRDLQASIADKQRAQAARQAQLAQLEQELTQVVVSPVQHEALQKMTALFSEKEAAWIEKSAAMESDFEGILKEFDRLTGTAVEFEENKLNYERKIEQLTQEVKQLEIELTEQKTNNLGYRNDTPSTASLRKEFRKMIGDMKADHQRALDREIEEKKNLEKQLKDLRHEREIARYQRINKGVQTLFVP